MPVLGPIYQHLISGHNILVYLALLAVPATCVGALPHPLRPAPARGRREPRRRRYRRRLGGLRLRYAARVMIAGVLCGIAGAYLSTAQPRASSAT